MIAAAPLRCNAGRARLSAIAAVSLETSDRPCSQLHPTCSSCQRRLAAVPRSSPPAAAAGTLAPPPASSDGVGMLCIKSFDLIEGLGVIEHVTPESKIISRKYPLTVVEAPLSSTFPHVLACSNNCEQPGNLQTPRSHLHSTAQPPHHGRPAYSAPGGLRSEMGCPYACRTPH